VGNYNKIKDWTVKLLRRMRILVDIVSTEPTIQVGLVLFSFLCAYLLENIYNLLSIFDFLTLPKNLDVHNLLPCVFVNVLNVEQSSDFQCWDVVLASYTSSPNFHLWANFWKYLTQEIAILLSICYNLKVRK
jgi:hypothetical protein